VEELGLSELSDDSRQGAAVDPEIWRGRRVLVTGHTGFKGAWLAFWLKMMGAKVVGLSDSDLGPPSLYSEANVGDGIDDRRADIRDADAVARIVADCKPEVVFHLAAQAFVRRSFREPLETYAVNVMGTANLLEAVRQAGGVRAVVVVTSDKCYDNHEQGRPFTEGDPMGGHDPYSNSKGCAELVTDAFRRSYFEGSQTNVASARAGNVIGGGDAGEDRLIPDLMRGALNGSPVPIRNPGAIRPWQHVLNPVSGYIELAQALLESSEYASGWNFGPDPADARPVSYLIERLSDRWSGALAWEIDDGPQLHEADYLSLDSTKAHEQLGWWPAWDLDRALDEVVIWFEALRVSESMREVSEGQIASYTDAPT